MKVFKYLVAAVIVAGGLISCNSNGGQPRYKDASLSVEKRVDDLISRMTLEEKVGQMNQFVGLEHIRASEAHLTEEELRTNTASAYYPGFPADTIERWTKEGLIGSFLHVLTIEEANYLQDLAMQSRLQIPIMFGIDAIHGNCNCPENTAYPTSIGLASSFNTDLAYTIARQTAAEMRAMNMHWTFNPNVEVARDARWGRCGETFGEDPSLFIVISLGINNDFTIFNIDKTTSAINGIDTQRIAFCSINNPIYSWSRIFICRIVIHAVFIITEIINHHIFRKFFIMIPISSIIIIIQGISHQGYKAQSDESKRHYDSTANPFSGFLPTVTNLSPDETTESNQ